jgi:fructose-1,6-bisphosphatase/inositol monophosphatase family enzyme
MTEHELEIWNGVLYKQHIMQVLIDAGLTDAINSDLYRSLFKGDGICAREIEYVDVFDALAAIKADGGCAVLAHPGLQESYDLVPALVDAGLDGIELFHEIHAPDDHARVLEIAREHGLVVTGGSDAHGTLGSIHAIGDFCAPSGAVEAITRTGNETVDWTVDLVRAQRRLVLSALVAERATVQKGGDNRDLVTYYDTEVERRLIDAIAEHFPDDAILTEERDEPPPNTDGALWIIDPIDGTTNFVTAHRDFAISVARYRNGSPEFGVVYDCAADILYAGIAGGGATRNGMRLLRRERVAREDAIIEISAATIERLRTAGERATVPVDDPAATTIAHRAQRAFGCASLGLCRVAEGLLDIYFSARLSVWDYAAAAIVLTETGGAYALERKEGDRPAAGPAVGAPPLVLHRERRIVIAAADRALRDETVTAYLGDAGSTLIQT